METYYSLTLLTTFTSASFFSSVSPFQVCHNIHWKYKTHIESLAEEVKGNLTRGHSKQIDIRGIALPSQEMSVKFVK